MLFADLVLDDGAVGVVAALLGVLTAVIALLFKLYSASLAGQVAELTTQRDHWREMALEAIGALEDLDCGHPRPPSCGKPPPRLPPPPPPPDKPPRPVNPAAELRYARRRLFRATQPPEEAGDGPPAPPNP